MPTPRKEWTDEDWAAAGYVRIVVHDHSTDDVVYVKRSFHSPVVTAHEREQLRARAMAIHFGNVRRRAKDIDRHRRVNNKAYIPYRDFSDARRAAKRKQDIEQGKISLDQMTFFDLI